jgi:kumamolisin
MPDHDLFLNTPPSERRRMSTEVFAALYGASDEDIAKVTNFASRHLTVVETNAARRTVVVSGTVSQMEASFAVKLGRFEHQIVPRTGAQPETETYRGLDGYIHIPENLAEIIIGVFGLDDRTVTMRNSSDDPPNTKHLKVSDITTLYNFPDQSAEGQTIAIFSTGGYDLDDIKDYFKGLGIPTPGIQNISIDDQENDAWSSRETTADICISSSAAPGASVAVYFTPKTERGWIDLIERVAIPENGDPHCSVLSSSYYHYKTDADANAKGKKRSIPYLSFQSFSRCGPPACHRMRCFGQCGK